MRVGQSVPRFDALAKVTGKEKYAADYYAEAGEESFVWAGVKRAGVPHGIIKRIDVSRAAGMADVVAVLTHVDVQGSNRQGVVKQDQPVLAEARVRHGGEAMALVVARSKTALGAALAAIEVEITALPGVFSMDEALTRGAVKIHEDNPSGNIVKEVSITKGRGEEAFSGCDVIVEMSFTTPRQEHAYLETEAGWARLNDDGTLTIVASTQTPFRDRFEIGHALGLDPEKIRIIAPYLGGAFGGKDGVTVQAFLALAALRTGGEPVKMWWDREESFLSGVKRLNASMDYRLGAKADGTMIALSCRLRYESGAYANLSGEIMTLGAEHAGGPYRIPHTSIRGAAVYTNNGLGGPFRGFGVPQVSAAIEQVVDELAARLGMDPIELRLKNVLVRGDENCIGVAMVRSTSARECLTALREHPLWQGRDGWKADRGAFKRRGVGVVCLLHAMGYPKDVPDRAGAKIALTGSGKIRVSTGVVDMGQGNGSVYLQMAGDLLNQDAEHLDLVLPDTSRTLPGGSASASRCVYVFGNALVDAAKRLRALILEKAARLAGVEDEALLALEPGLVRHKQSGEAVPFSRIAADCTDGSLEVSSVFTSPTAAEDSGLIYMGPHILYSYAAHLVRIEVDELTGAVEVRDYLAVTDGGKVLNPQMYDQQIQGSISQGLGYALTERFAFRDGFVMTPNLATYTIPTACDIPDMVSVAVEVVEETGPFGMKGVGEIGINGPLPAVANALADALNVRIEGAPFTGEKVLKGMGDRD